jgi:hypothetical protein
MRENSKYTPDPNGLYQKYVVHSLDGKQITDCFTMRIADPHARKAMRCYADSVESENKKLAEDLRLWVEHEDIVDRIVFHDGEWRQVRLSDDDNALLTTNLHKMYDRGFVVYKGDQVMAVGEAVWFTTLLTGRTQGGLLIDSSEELALVLMHDDVVGAFVTMIPWVLTIE